jgi:Fe2+ transport system protein B
MAATYFIEKIKYYKKEYYTTILYNNIDLVKPQNHNMLIEDIENRLGIKINRIEINNYDFDKNIVKINVYFYQNHDVNNKIDYRNSIKDY